mgnify:CR=1 FL=1
MATAAFEEIAETFEFLDDWEDRYRHVIDLGKAMPPLDEAFRVPATKVDGCASQVWLRPTPADGAYDFQGESDAMIVRGLIAVLHALYSGVPLAQVARIDASAERGTGDGRTHPRHSRSCRTSLNPSDGEGVGSARAGRGPSAADLRERRRAKGILRLAETGQSGAVACASQFAAAVERCDPIRARTSA